MPLKKLSASVKTDKKEKEYPWKEGDIVIHGNDGICRITGIRAENLVGEGLRDYYILVPLYNSSLTIYVETDGAEETLRRPMGEDEIRSVIAAIPTMEMEWIRDEKERHRILQEKLRDPKVGELIPVIRALYRKKQEVLGKGKKFHSADEQILNRAETIVNRELAHGLGIDPDKVPGYIQRIVEGS